MYNLRLYITQAAGNNAVWIFYEMDTHGYLWLIL
uniref:Uncharacterized protein n=1 Tax=Anguilla anguilla TaxID=7936 RepID=A0A0E9VYX3_ANGAN